MNSITPLMLAWWSWIALFAFWLAAALFAHRTRSSEGFLQRLQHSIPLGLAFVLIFTRHREFVIYGPLYGTGWANWIVYPGLVMTVCGCLFAVWAQQPTLRSRSLGMHANLLKLSVDFDDPLGVWSGEKNFNASFKKIIRRRVRTRPDFQSQEPLMLYNHAAESTGADAPLQGAA